MEEVSSWTVVLSLLSAIIVAVVSAAVQAWLGIKKHREETRQKWLLEKRLYATQLIVTSFTEYYRRHSPWLASPVAFRNYHEQTEPQEEEGFELAREARLTLQRLVDEHELVLGRGVLNWYWGLGATFDELDHLQGTYSRTRIIAAWVFSSLLSDLKGSLSAACAADLRDIDVYLFSMTDWRETTKAARKQACQLFSERMSKAMPDAEPPRCD